MTDLDRILDRVIGLAPLGVLVYLARRHEHERQRLLELLDRDRDAFRNERRELVNRVTHPGILPTGTRAPSTPSTNGAGPPPVPSPLAEKRAQWARVGMAAPAAPPPPDAPPGDGDDVQP